MVFTYKPLHPRLPQLQFDYTDAKGVIKLKGPLSIPRPLVRTNQWVIVICVVLTWFTGAYWLLAVPLVSGLLGLLTNFNPVMRLAKVFLRKRPSEYAQEDREQQQFNQIIAVSCLVVGLFGYWMHWMVLAYISTAIVAAAAFVAILGFCIGCFIQFQWKQYQYRRRSRRV